MRLTSRALLVALLTLFSLSVTAQGTDVVFVFNASQSMERSDPDQGRVTAGSVFAQLLEDEDSLGVIEYRARPHVVVPLMPLDSRSNRTWIIESLDALSTAGDEHNLARALERATEMFDLTTDHERVMVLVTDHVEDELQVESAALRSVIEECQRNSITIHTIAVGHRADSMATRRLAAWTGGEHRLASGSSNLCEAMLQLLPELNGTQRIPVDEGSAVIDPSVEEAIFVLSDENSSVTGPEGALLQADDRGCIVVRRPVPGEWIITPSESALAVIANSDQRLVVNPSLPLVRAGEPFDLIASLGGMALSEEAILEVSVNGEALPNSQQITLNPGRHDVALVSQWGDMARETHLLLEAQEEGLRLEISPTDPQAGESVVVEAWVTLEDHVAHDALQARLMFSDDTSRWVDLLPADLNHFATLVELPENTRLTDVQVSLMHTNEQAGSGVFLRQVLRLGGTDHATPQVQMPPVNLPHFTLDTLPTEVADTEPTRVEPESASSGAANPEQRFPDWVIYLVTALAALVSGGVTMYLALKSGRPNFPSAEECEAALKAEAEAVEQPPVEEVVTEPEPVVNEVVEADESIAEEIPTEEEAPAEVEAEPEPERVEEVEPEPEQPAEEPQELVAEEEEKPAKVVEAPAEVMETPVEEVALEETSETEEAEVTEEEDLKPVAEPEVAVEEESLPEEVPVEELVAEEPEELPEMAATEEVALVVEEDLILTADEMQSIFGDALGGDEMTDESERIDFGDEDLVLSQKELNSLFEQATLDPVSSVKVGVKE